MSLPFVTSQEADPSVETDYWEKPLIEWTLNDICHSSVAGLFPNVSKASYTCSCTFYCLIPARPLHHRQLCTCPTRRCVDFGPLCISGIAFAHDLFNYVQISRHDLPSVCFYWRESLFSSKPLRSHFHQQSILNMNKPQDKAQKKLRNNRKQNYWSRQPWQSLSGNAVV